ncbi:succinate dehydrogenase, cytochrome b556 subunit [uncultured Aliiroseovarius sp.]|uniref:succinate dehydrogenase, cytochrome b556 subunit n=1 Tax=uncultured Aliiroseovarius sp. TaxID=1658783 RepID=UPI0025922182|nr:succinate dehydrogenase, cytochrome b556 subunit [uncultured Aliiroseovarius sp.]
MTRPKSPNMQNYRPQLTSVLSVGHRLSGVALAIGAFAFTVWLACGAFAPRAFDTLQTAALSLPGQVVLFLVTLALFYHLCNGIRHLIWDSVRALELRSIYAGGWGVVGASLLLTIAFWVWGLA